MMKKLIPLLILALSLLSVTESLAQASATVLVREQAPLGKFLIDPRGFTLYMFKNDKPGESTCYDACAQTWPAFIAADALTRPPGVAGKLDVHTRKDGTKQVTYNAMPLYFYAPDTSPGDTKGQGRGNVWFVVAPQLAPAQLPKSGGPALSNEALVWALTLAALMLLGAGFWLRRRTGA